MDGSTSPPNAHRLATVPAQPGPHTLVDELAHSNLGDGNTTYSNGTVGRDHRNESLEKLKNGELDVIFSVDVFNEGMDLPEIDTVMMLRPTESRVLWLQQLWRGLRKTEGKQHLVVIDDIGNHRTFLVKLQTLFMELAACSRGSDAELRQLLDQLAQGKLVLPDGCDVTYELETLDILKEGGAFFAYEGGVFRSTVRSDDAAGLSALAREIVEWRVAEYLDRNLLDQGAFKTGSWPSEPDSGEAGPLP